MGKEEVSEEKVGKEKRLQRESELKDEKMSKGR